MMVTDRGLRTLLSPTFPPPTKQLTVLHDMTTTSVNTDPVATSSDDIAHTLTDTTKRMNPLSLEQNEDSNHGSLAASDSYGSMPTQMNSESGFTDEADGIMRMTHYDSTLPTVNDSIRSIDGDDPHHDHPLPHNPHHPHGGGGGKLGVVGLAVIVFYSVSGGPFGVEAAVRSAGNFYALLGFLLMPFVWSLPEALMTAELGAAIPEAAGGVAWVELAFGKQAGWLCGYLAWISGATDNAIYPVLFLDYVIAAFDIKDHMDPWTRWFLLALCSSGLSYLNWLGLPTVEKMSIIICVIAMSPFVILCLIGVFQVQPHRWFEMPEFLPTDDDATVTDDDNPTRQLGGSVFSHFSIVHWGPFLNNLFWNGNSFDNCANFAGDVDNPGRVFPKALTMSVIMVAACYFIPLLVALGASTAPPEAWVDGYLAKAASDIVGPWLGGWTVFAAGISNIAMFQAELSSDAFQLMGMADRGYLPHIFSKRSRYGTPTYGILLGTVVIVLMTLSDFEGLIEMLNFQYAISLMMEYCAFLKLRVSHADMHRPYRIPFGIAGCILLFIPPICMTLLIMSLASTFTLFFSLAVNVFGIVLFQCSKERKKKYEHLAVAEETP